jgi:OmpA-OmpF porin, OOP family
MSKKLWFAILGMSVPFLAACAEQGQVADAWIKQNIYQEPYAAAEAAEPKGSEFNRRLYEGYLALAAAEREEYDWADSGAFSKKALAAAEDQDVTPDSLYDRKLPADARDELSAARKDLIDLLQKGARNKAPGSAAEAQVSFDCWMQEQEENRQPADIATCRERFQAALAQFKTAKQSPSVGSHIVYFKTGSADFGKAQLEKLMKAAALAKGNSAKVLVSGHADSAGSSAKNDALSEARAKAVADLLISAGVKAERIEAEHYGAARPAVETTPGVAEPKNRRVEIRLIQ